MNVRSTEELDRTLERLARKDPVLFRAVRKKIDQITLLDANDIRHFKNLRGDLSDYKRVHVGKSFVLFFKCEGDTVIFDRLEHHDKAYGR